MNARILFDPNEQLIDTRWEKNKTNLIHKEFTTSLQNKVDQWLKINGYGPIYEESLLRGLNTKLRVRQLDHKHFPNSLVSMTVKDACEDWERINVNLECPKCDKSKVQQFGDRYLCRACGHRFNKREATKVIQ